MRKKTMILSILFLMLFLSSALYVSCGTIAANQTALDFDGHNAIPAEYPSMDKDRRNSPVSILVYTEFADIISDTNNEFRNSIDAIKSAYGEQFRYENLTDYADLSIELPKYDIFLIVEQELIYEDNITTIASVWSSPLENFINSGGILVVLDCYSPISSFAGPSLLLVNATGVVSISDPDAGTGWTNNLVSTTDALARGVEGSWLSPNGSVRFNTTDCEVIVDDGVSAVAAHKIMGAGHIVLLGFDLYEGETNSHILLANAIRLHRHVVFDDSHAQAFDINGDLVGPADYFSTSGFAVSSMTEFSEEYLAACDIFVITLCYVPYNQTEVNILVEFVENGGGLFVCSDFGSYGSESDDLIERFGFNRYDSTNAISDSDDGIINEFQIPFEGENIHNHSITLGVNRVELYSCAAFTIVPENGYVLIETDGDGTATLNNTAVAACATYGSGRVVVIGDSNILTDSDSDTDGTSNFQDSENEVFFLNAIRWLSAAGIEEKTVLFDASHNYNLYVTASYRGFANFLTENGYTVFWMSTFHESLVDDTDVFVVEDGSIAYTNDEVDFIADFVSDGGKLFLLGGRDDYGNETDPIGNKFGLDLNNTGHIVDTDDSILIPYYIVYNTSNFGNHPIMQGLSRVEAHYGTAFQSIGSATALITTDNDGTSQWAAGGLANALPIMAAKEHNKGRVVYSADYWIPRDNQDGDLDSFSNLYDSDNPLLLLNIFFWLIEDRAPTVEIIFPNGGEVLNGTQTFTWEGEDFDDDPMEYDFYLTDDNGGNWYALEYGLTVTEYELNTTFFGDGDNYLVRVVVHANGLTAVDDSDGPFSIDNLPDPIIPPPTDLTMIVVIIAGAAVILIIIVIVMKKKK